MTPSPTPTPSVIASLAAPDDVAANIVDRELVVSWSPVAGAASHKVAARLANGVEPFEWSEYDADAPPYVITDTWAGMSGLEYEVRAASVNADGRSEWSPAVMVVAPELRAAPGAILVRGPGHPYAVGDLVQVGLTLPNFSRRSRYVWSVCEMDGSRCELLPHVARGSSRLSAPEAARGKRVQVQVDYNADGISYTALADAGVVNPEEGPRPPFLRPSLPDGCEDEPAPSEEDSFRAEAILASHLHYATSHSVHVRWDPSSGGAIEPLCNDLLVATPLGRMGLVRSDGRVEWIEGQVPMNIEGWRGTGIRNTFRVADILLRQRTAETWELYATHHYFTGECIRFRLSATEVLIDGGSVSLSPSWRTVFDAEPCLPLYKGGSHAGGRMLTDGPDHLLIVIGDHAQFRFPQDSASHFGKLVRVAIGSGEAEILSSGFRNPQGFARDADGVLWSVEHGPQGGDELNLLEPGRDYGWPSVSYGVHSPGHALQGEEEEGGHEGFAKPRFAWVPSIAVSPLIVNDARWFPLWKDDLLAGSLAGNSLFRIRRAGTDIQYVERIEVGYRIRDLAQMPDGRIALLRDAGRVYFIRRFVEICDERPWPSRRVYGLHCYSPGDEDEAQAQSEAAQEGSESTVGPSGG